MATIREGYENHSEAINWITLRACPSAAPSKSAEAAGMAVTSGEGLVAATAKAQLFSCCVYASLIHRLSTGLRQQIGAKA
jgi:hypothetical protein